MNFVATLPRLAAGSAIFGLALLTFFQFPGHTWLQQDTQIYAPILEHLRDPSVLDRDLVDDQIGNIHSSTSCRARIANRREYMPKWPLREEGKPCIWRSGEIEKSNVGLN